MYGIQFAEHVATDVVEQHRFLDTRQSGRGELFLDDLQSTFEILKANPYMFQKRYNAYRIALTRRFRYKVNVTNSRLVTEALDVDITDL